MSITLNMIKVICILIESHIYFCGNISSGTLKNHFYPI